MLQDRYQITVDWWFDWRDREWSLYRAEKNMCFFKTFMWNSSQHITKRMPASHHLRAGEIEVGYVRNSKPTAWWILAGISSKSTVMLFGMEHSWNICCPRSDQQVLQNAVRTQNPLGGRTRPGAPGPCSSVSESILLKQNCTLDPGQHRV